MVHPDAIIVGHAMRAYLRQTHTFIWQMLRHSRASRPIVLCKKTLNLEQFPLDTGDVVRFGRPVGSPAWWANAWQEQILRVPCGGSRREIRRFGVELLHAHFGGNGSRWATLAAREELPLVTSFYGRDAYNEQAASGGYERLFDIGRLFLVEGAVLRERLVELGCPPRKVEIQPISVPVDAYPFRRRARKEEEDGGRSVQILFVGRLVEKKGLEFGLRALAGILGKHAFRLRVVGDGPLRPELEGLASDLGLGAHIDWLGSRPHGFVLGELDRGDVLLQPSVTARDGDSEGGAPTILLEAQACGMPILSSMHADIPDVAPAGAGAVLAPERDVDALTHHLDSLLAAPDRWGSMGEAGRRHVTENHDAETEVWKLEQRYAQLLGRSHGVST